MTRDVLLLSADMPLREAARQLLRNQIGGAPVMNDRGRCVGMLSSIDFLRLAGRRTDVTKPAAPPLPVTCTFQRKYQTPEGREKILCSLPPGVCPMQRQEQDSPGHTQTVCSEPHCVLTDWQVVDVEKLPADEVCHFMTPDPVTVAPDASINELARKMIDAHIHRLIVVDAEETPIGIVTSTDLLAALAYGAAKQ